MVQSLSENQTTYLIEDGVSIVRRQANRAMTTAMTSYRKIKRQRTAALQDAGAISRKPLSSPGFGVGLSSTAFIGNLPSCWNAKSHPCDLVQLKSFRPAALRLMQEGFELLFLLEEGGFRRERR
jgi:hypothetical protein